VENKAKEKTAANSHAIKKESLIEILSKDCPTEEKLNR
jgi:hypothetical protein